MPLIECVPNVSEGRREDVIAALAKAVDGPSVHRLDQSSDPSHNRTVYTFAGEPAAVQAAVHTASTHANTATWHRWPADRGSSAGILTDRQFRTRTARAGARYPRGQWRRGRVAEATACKAVNPGSIPGVASTDGPPSR